MTYVYDETYLSDHVTDGDVGRNSYYVNSCRMSAYGDSLSPGSLSVLDVNDHY